MSAPRPEHEIAGEDEELPQAEATLESLVDEQDVDGLLALARAYRSGTDGKAKDLKRCYECYRAAGDLGSAEGDYASALFLAAGGVVERDLKELAHRVRRAAEGGHTQAKVYVGNLYELGVHYGADKEKADVWYRNAARSAGIEHDPASPEYARAMALLGCVRQCLALADDPATSADDRAAFLRKARTFGAQLRAPTESPDSKLTPAPRESVVLDEAMQPPPAPASAPKKPAVEKQIKDDVVASSAEMKKAAADTERAVKRAPKRPLAWGAGLAAFTYASTFSGVGLGAGYLALVGAREWLRTNPNATLPLLGRAPEPLYPAIYVLLGVLPAFLAYKGATVLRAIAFAGLTSVLGWALWASPSAGWPTARFIQALGYGAAGFLAALLVLGIFGGAKRKPPPRTPVI